MLIPPDAWGENQFQEGDEVVFIAGSRRSGGLGLRNTRSLANAVAPLGARALAHGRIKGIGSVVVPAEVGIKPNDRLLVVRGSGRALSFPAHGPIYEEALQHPDLPCFGEEAGQ